MKDLSTHVEKTDVPGFGQEAMADLMWDTMGIASELPKTAGTGCGKRRKLSDTTMVPEEVTCLACAEYGRAQQLQAAHTAESLMSLGDGLLALLATPGKAALTVAKLEEMAAEHRAMAARYPRAEQGEQQEGSRGSGQLHGISEPGGRRVPAGTAGRGDPRARAVVA